MNDFKTHVLEGRLNKRRWVLQERALAHRTIFFTDRQTYWECGEGVKCETLTKMDKQFHRIAFRSKLAETNTSKASVGNSLTSVQSKLQFSGLV
jgi:hypothetical protein